MILLAANAAAGPLRVVASTPDMAAVAGEIGGTRVQVDALCGADQDPHAFELLPRHALAVQAAQVYLKVGAGLDPWADKLIQAAGNPHMLVADCAKDIALVQAAACDHEHEHEPQHHAGNPHYWLGPANLPQIAATICAALQAADSAHTAEYAAGRTAFTLKLDSAYAQWKTILEPCRGRALASTHSSWDYFARDFELRIIGTISDIPDSEPSPRSFAELLAGIRNANARVLLCEPFAATRIPELLARETGIQILIAPTSVGAIPEAADLWSQFHYLASEIARRCGSPQARD